MATGRWVATNRAQYRHRMFTVPLPTYEKFFSFQIVPLRLYVSIRVNRDGMTTSSRKRQVPCACNRESCAEPPSYAIKIQCQGVTIRATLLNESLGSKHTLSAFRFLLSFPFSDLLFFFLWLLTSFCVHYLFSSLLHSIISFSFDSFLVLVLPAFFSITFLCLLPSLFPLLFLPLIYLAISISFVCLANNSFYIYLVICLLFACQVAQTESKLQHYAKLRLSELFNQRASVKSNMEKLLWKIRKYKWRYKSRAKPNTMDFYFTHKAAHILDVIE
jgi:hypothetical protein